MDKSKFELFEAKAYETVYAEPELTYHRKLIPKMVAEILPLFDLKLDDFIVDMGCGPGVFLQEMRDLHYTNLVGVTLSEEDFVICAEKDFDVIKADITDVPLNSDAVDFIWCRHAIEHSPYPLYTLFEFNRLLKMGGKAYIEVPAPDCDRKHEGNDNHYSILGNTMWQALFAKAGFNTIYGTMFNFDITAEGHTAKETYIIYGIEKCKQLFPS